MTTPTDTLAAAIIDLNYDDDIYDRDSLTDYLSSIPLDPDSFPSLRDALRAAIPADLDYLIDSDSAYAADIRAANRDSLIDEITDQLMQRI